MDWMGMYQYFKQFCILLQIIVFYNGIILASSLPGNHWILQMGKKTKSNPLKIAITGPESTGKSTLTNLLAERFNGLAIPEYARTFLEKTGPEYRLKDIEKIAKTQAAIEDSFSRKTNRVLFCDTDILVCRIWAEHVFGVCPESILDTEKKQHYDLTLLMNIDIPWIKDPFREHPLQRDVIFNKYKHHLDISERAYFIVSGDGESRLNTSIDIIRNQLGLRPDLIS